MARSLDDLDRLAFRLSRTIRTQHPQLLTQGFTLSDLEERLLPFREVRREMADGGADAFETMLLRLVAGDREYVLAEPALQSACRQALAFPSPTLAMVRAWATSTLQLNQVTRPQSSHPATTGATPGAATTGATTTGAAALPAFDWDHELFPTPGSGSGPMVDRDGGVSVGGALRGTSPAAPIAHACCRFCDNRLPQGRAVTYCPHCGMDLTKRQCPACSTELEVHWRFCVTCGRQDAVSEH